jgi:hypothetical protein
VRLDFYISELLYSHDCVIVPGLGGFVTHERGSFLNPAQHTFAPPARKVAFNASLRISDGILAHAISRTRGIPFQDAMDLIQLVVEDIVQRLKAGETVLIEKVGTLVYDKEMNLQFEPEVNENYLPSSFGLTMINSPAIRREEKHAIKPAKQKLSKKEATSNKSRWRLLELVPAAAILALLAFNPKVTRDLNASLASFVPLNSSATVTESHPVQLPAAEFKAPEEVQIVTPEVNAEPYTSTSDESTPIAEVVADTTRVAAPVIINKVEPVSGNYLVIGGCFREEANAQKFIQQASEAGFDARISGLNKKGLHVVSLYNGSNKAEAQQLLEEARITLEPNTWMKRVQ